MHTTRELTRCETASQKCKLCGMITTEEIAGEEWASCIGSHRKSAGANAKSCGKFTSTLVVHLIRNPILKVLSSIQEHRVRALLIGGQACVFYGAAEFSRDTDVSPHVRRRSAMTLITIKPVPSNRTRALGENNPSQ